MIFFQQFLLNVNSYRPEMEDTQSDQAEPDASKSDVVKIYETFIVDNESMDGEQIESEGDDIYIPFSIFQFIIKTVLRFLFFFCFLSFISFLSMQKP